MRRPSSSHAALIVSVLALFAALGGTSVAAFMVGTNQIKNGAVTNSKLGANAVTSSRVKDGSLTAADIAPNTFLPAHATATNSDSLGNRPAGDYLLGRGQMFVNRVEVPAGQSALILSGAFGDLVGNCAPGGIPQVQYISHTSQVNLVDWVTDYGSPNGTASIHTTNGLSNGGTYTESHNTVVPQAITWQAAYDDGTPHVMTAWTSGQDILGSSCIFIGQALSTN